MLSSAFYFYANALMKLGARKHLEQEDLWDVAPDTRPRASSSSTLPLCR